jgi:hypothetical protein
VPKASAIYKGKMRYLRPWNFIFNSKLNYYNSSGGVLISIIKVKRKAVSYATQSKDDAVHYQRSKIDITIG